LESDGEALRGPGSIREKSGVWLKSVSVARGSQRSVALVRRDRPSLGEQAMNTDNLYVYGATYLTEDDARFDLDAFQDIVDLGVVGKYDTALVSKDAKGKVHVKKQGTSTGAGAWKGALAGGVVGLIFPPSILAGAVVGGISGAVAGDRWGGMSRSELNELGQLLDVGEWGLVIVGESLLDEYIDKSLNKAQKKVNKVVKADRKEIEKDLHALES
jgi:uncharacterized membrane protein